MRVLAQCAESPQLRVICVVVYKVLEVVVVMAAVDFLVVPIAESLLILNLHDPRHLAVEESISVPIVFR